jgi:hypothetical protein
VPNVSCSLLCNSLALLGCQLLGAGITTLLADELTESDGRRVLAIRLVLREFGLTCGHVHDEFGELIEVFGGFCVLAYCCYAMSRLEILLQIDELSRWKEKSGGKFLFNFFA